MTRCFLSSVRADRGLPPPSFVIEVSQLQRDRRRRGKTQETVFHLASLLPSASSARSAADRRTPSESPVPIEENRGDRLDRETDQWRARPVTAGCTRRAILKTHLDWRNFIRHRSFEGISFIDDVAFRRRSGKISFRRGSTRAEL